MPSNQSDIAKQFFLEECNCAQAIFAVYGEPLSVGKVDFGTCLKIASAFGGGIAQTGNVCGALIGALMVLGFKYGGGERGKNCAYVARRLLNEFKSLNGSIMCRELIGFIPSQVTGEDLQQAFQKRTFDKCQKYVKDVSKMLEKLL